ncbi:MAG: hypothetical protein J3Q66DRAFT_358729 [Benniella sp.]|nr:MAG: hypothetical protein J3Q66DRAFT_358729 [Benniella sp.]
MSIQPELDHREQLAHAPLDRPCPIAKLAPEVVVHILSFLQYHDSPARLLPILTLCKSWARLALELIYRQPVVNLRKIAALVNTLRLQDLQNGQMPLWDPVRCASSGPTLEASGMSLGIDYRAMIKMPCRIVGTAAPIKQNLTHLWELEALLLTAPAFAVVQASHASDTNDSSPPSSSLSPPSSPSSVMTSFTHSVAPQAVNDQRSPTPPSPPSSPSSPVCYEHLGHSNSAPAFHAPIPQRKTYMARRKKKSLPTPPTVLLLDIAQDFSDTMQYILQEVRGMKLACLHYKWRLNVPLLDLIESNLASLRELSFLRPPTRRDELLAMAQLLGRAKHIETIKLENCQAAGSTVLAEIARSCGSSLRTLEIRQHIMMRPMGEHSVFPVDGPEDWNRSDLETPLCSMMEPGPACSHCDAIITNSRGGFMESLVHQLDISGTSLSTEAASAPADGSDTVPADTDLDSRMDHALSEFGTHCTNLSRVRLQNITWLSDESLIGFKPRRDRLGLREIKLLDSNYGSRVTIEGMLGLCGPDLEVLVVDRKSCWRTRHKPISKLPQGLCPGCADRETARQGRISTMSTGDQLVFGLIQRGQGLGCAEPRTRRIRRLNTLALIEHWVSVSMLKDAMQYWRSTLRKVNFRLFKCSIKDLKEALLVTADRTTPKTALRELTLSLPWLDIADPDVEELVRVLFDSHKGLRCVEINKRGWGRDEMAIHMSNR